MTAVIAGSFVGIAALAWTERGYTVKLIDADALGIGKCNPAVFENKGYANGWNAVIDLINAAPTIDAVPVVRCKDCKYCHIEDEYEAWCHGGLPAVLTRATEDFCSHGQRREDGEDVDA